MSEQIIYKLVNTPVGEMVAGATDRGLCLLEFHRPARWNEMKNKISEIYKAELIEGTDAFIGRAEKELHEYFDRKRKKFSVPLDVRGTDFEIKVWKQLSKIRYGELTSYSRIAKDIDNPKAVRAVGGANGSNHIAIIIPCHRVIGGNGSLTGYGGGIDKKTFLLALERGNGFL